MGYNIHLKFYESKDVSNKENLIKEFCDVGFTRLSDDNPWALIFMQPGYISGFLMDFIENDKERNDKGYWAILRYSWGTDPIEFEKSILMLLDISKKLKFKVFDPQCNTYYTEDNTKEFGVVFEKHSGHIIKMVGNTKNNSKD